MFSNCWPKKFAPDVIDGIVTDRGLTPRKVTRNLRRVIDFTDDKLDYVGAFLDATTNYYAHTGTQTAAQHLIQRAAGI